jgi:hypothetical protein
LTHEKRQPKKQYSWEKNMKTFPRALIVVVWLVTACAPHKEHTPTPANTDTPNPPTATPIIQPPDDTYSTSITKEELLGAGMTEAYACENAGVFAMTVAGDKWNVIQTATAGCTVLNPKFGGTWKFAGDQVTFHDNAPFGCPADYTYQWTYNGSSIRFTSIDDTECPQRVYYMSEHPWVK